MNVNDFDKYINNKYPKITNKINYFSAIKVDAYFIVANFLRNNEHFILKGGFNLFANYGYFRGKFTTDIDISINGIELTNAKEIIAEYINGIDHEIYKFEITNMNKLDIVSNGYNGFNINFQIIIKGTKLITSGSIDVAIEEINNSSSIIIKDGYRIYSIERTIGDKYLTAIQKGRSNSRRKDFIDICNLYRMSINKNLLIEVIKKLYKYKNVDYKMIVDWEDNYSEWIKKYNVEGLEQVLSEIIELLNKNS